jgi:hypothetical protein
LHLQLPKSHYSSQPSAQVSISLIETIGLRAYISVDSREEERAFQIDHHGKVIVRTDMTNRGQTPAYNVRIKSRFKLLDGPASEDFDYSIPDRASSVITLGAHQSVAMICYDSERYLGSASLTEVDMQTTRQRVMLYGVVTYQTTFGEKAFTEFCFSSYWSEGRIEWIASPSHNRAT